MTPLISRARRSQPGSFKKADSVFVHGSYKQITDPKNSRRATPRSQYPGRRAGSVLCCSSLGVGRPREISRYYNTLTSKRKTRHCVVGYLRRENNEGSGRLTRLPFFPARVSESRLPVNCAQTGHSPHCTSQDALRKLGQAEDLCQLKASLVYI